MSLKLDWKPAARRDLSRLDPQVRARIVTAVTALAETHRGDVVKLTDKHPPEYRLRVGGWRVRLAWDQAAGLLVVLHVFRRGQGYE